LARDITFGSGKFVTVGDRGLIYTSVDGITWDDGKRTTTNMLHKVVFANGRFLAVGDNGAIVVSPDGNAWTNEISGPTNGLYSIAYDHGMYVACGQAGTLVISTDASMWTVASNGTADLNWIAGGNGVFILASTNSGVNGQMAVQVSLDAMSWTRETFP